MSSKSFRSGLRMSHCLGSMSLAIRSVKEGLQGDSSEVVSDIPLASPLGGTCSLRRRNSKSIVFKEEELMKK